MCNILVDTKAVVYVDDPLMGGKNEAEHDANLGEVLSKLEQVGMHINKDKMQLGKNHVLFWRYDICRGNFSLDSYIAVQQTTLPCVSSRHEIKKILGISNLCRATCLGLAIALNYLQSALRATTFPTSLELEEMVKEA